MQTTGERLKWARIRAGYRSARAAALDNEWPESTYRAQEGDQRNLLEPEARKYARRFAVSWKWLLSEEGEPTSTATPLPKEINVDHDTPEDQVVAVVRTVRGARYFTAYHTYFTDERRPPCELIGEECVIRLPDGQTLVRRLLQGTKRNAYHLEGPKGHILENQKIEWAEPLRWRG